MSNIKFHILKGNWVRTILIGLLIALFSASVSIFFRMPVQLANPMKSTLVELPEERSYCPGEHFAYKVEQTIVRAPVIVSAAVSWWNVDQRITSLPGTSLSYLVFTEPIKFIRPVSITIPALAPGRYEYRRGIQADSSETQAFAIPITITLCAK